MLVLLKSATLMFKLIQVGDEDDMASIFIIEQVMQGGPMRVKQPRWEIIDKWWTCAGKTSKGRKLMKEANGGPVRANQMPIN